VHYGFLFDSELVALASHPGEFFLRRGENLSHGTLQGLKGGKGVVVCGALLEGRVALAPIPLLPHPSDSPRDAGDGGRNC